MTALRLATLLRTLTRFWLYLLVGLTPFVFTWVNEELFEFNKMLIVYALTFCAVLTWIARMSVEKAWKWQKTAFDIPLLLFFLSQVASTVFSLDPRTSFFGYYTRFNGGLLSTITYMAIYFAVVHTIPVKERGRLFAVLLTSSAAAALFALPEHFGHSVSCLLISGSFDTQCWVQDVQSRIFGTFGQPNWLAAYLAQLAPLLVAIWGIATSGKHATALRHTIFAVLLAVSVFTALYTQSRSGILAFGLGLGLLLGGTGLLWALRYRHTSSESKAATQSFRTIGVAVALVAASMLLNGTPYTPSLSTWLKPAAISETAVAPEVVVGTVLDSGGTDSGEIRKIVWTGALRVWQRYPLFGSGLETFAYSYYKDRPMEHNLVSEWDFLYNKAHNEFLNMLATAGAVGLATYVLLLAWIGIIALKKVVHPATSVADATLLLALLSGMTAVSVSNFFGFSTVMVQVLLFIFAALIAQIVQTPTTTVVAQPEQKVTREIQSEHYLVLSLVFVIALFGLAWIHRIWSADATFAHGKALLAAQQYLEGTLELRKATQMIPDEALFSDELSLGYAYLSLSAAGAGDATTSAQLAESALLASSQALQLNPHHVSFYRTRTRMLIALGQLEPSFLEEAALSLEAALALAPTDAKLMYNLGIVRISQGKIADGISALEEAIRMKPNYAVARLRLAEQYSATNKLNLAAQEYRYILEKINPDDANTRMLLTQVEATISAQKR